MSTSIKIIKYLTVLCIIFMGLTYAIFLNMEKGYVILKSGWISNNLLFTIFSGAFASGLVVVLSEIRQYLINKKHTHKIFFSLSLLLSMVNY